jgi:DNA-binding CsgD family transcriptional regulator
VKTSTIDVSRLSDVNIRLGDTVTDPSIRPEVMQEICAAVNSTGAALLQSDVRNPGVPITGGVTDLFQNYFGNNWHTRDIRADRGVPLLLQGRSVVTDQDFVSPEEMRTVPFYNECVFPTGFEWFAAVGFRAGSALWGLSIHRTAREGPFEGEDKHLLATMSDRLTEVATLSTAVGRIALSSAANALNSVHHPAISIDRFGFVLDVNIAAAELFDDEIRIRNRRLFTTDRQARGLLEELLDGFRMASDIDPFPSDPILIRRRDKVPVLVRILPVHGAARSPFLDARALLTFSSIETKPDLSPTLLRKAFNLTPAEGKLAVLIAQGNSPEQIAEQLGIARVTARNQLRAVFAKTGTHRQSELVALLARL